MRRLSGVGVGLGCFVVLLLACFGTSLFQNRQPAYRDAGHYYYPLYLRVQQEWNAGRLPLWEPEENGGMPLLGNPTAAVLYPGKIIYAILPYPWAARIYIIAHVALAGATMFLLMRRWSASPTGSAIAAISYAFGAPILFQYCNIIFLVGAAWLPLAIHGMDRWVRLGRRWGILELALVLALQTLGGDPQVSFVTGLIAAAYAVFQVANPVRDRLLRHIWKLLVLVIVLWMGGTLGAAFAVSHLDLRAHPFAQSIGTIKDAVPGLFETTPGKSPLGPTWGDLISYRTWRILPLAAWLAVGTWFLTPRRGDIAGWLWWSGLAGIAIVGVAAAILGKFAFGLLAGVLVVTLLVRPKGVPRGESEQVLRIKLLGLVAAAILGTTLMGVQLLPTLEYARLTVRSAQQGTHEIFPFSLEPFRLLELGWPQVFGTSFTNEEWLKLLPPTHVVKFWVPSIYLGGLTLILAIGALGFREGPPSRRLLSAITFVSLSLALGQFASPLWYARMVPGAKATIGAHDPLDFGELRRDGELADGVGSPYWLLATFVPGFRSFRFPSKFLTFTCLGLAGLAGIGWDRLAGRESRRSIQVGLSLATIGLLLGLAIVLGADELRAYWQTRMDTGVTANTTFGAFNPMGALSATRRSLVHGTLAIGLATFTALLAARGVRAARPAALALLTVDLMAANAGLVRTVPQEVLEGTPRVLELIRKAEANSGTDQPYRIHRMPIWEPLVFRETNSEDRVLDLVTWERRTIQPKYAIPHGAEYTITMGVSELYDYWFFFAPFLSNHDDEFGARRGLKPGQRLVYYPRRGFDLWNSRYFVIPRVPSNEENRAIVMFLPNTERIYPPESEVGPMGSEDTSSKRWDTVEDWQILRNKQAFPRAWIVHQIRRVNPIEGLKKEDRQAVMEEIVYQGDELWFEPGRRIFDPKRLAWVETADVRDIEPYPVDGPDDPSEKVSIVHYEPTRVELEAALTRPGLVVLADVYYPGWRLTIDDKPAPIFRVNRMMRGAAVPSGTHRLVYTYEPDSVSFGVVTTVLGLVFFALTAAWSWKQPRIEPPIRGSRTGSELVS